MLSVPYALGKPLITALVPGWCHKQPVNTLLAIQTYVVCVLSLICLRRRVGIYVPLGAMPACLIKWLPTDKNQLVVYRTQGKGQL